ncbi:hypothetical protein AALO_G00217220 [Alosa alosa]|uniref:Uncharacterized protein n=1 Tax=Alosa alosa TaxID=278164 RepID=A0AAV6G174_9TELE|nr:hypothetical protein AALO_G00217220 [Alosa alosa]
MMLFQTLLLLCNVRSVHFLTRRDPPDPLQASSRSPPPVRVHLLDFRMQMLRRTRGMKIGILTVIEDDQAMKAPDTVTNIAIVLEETVVLQDIKDFPSALAYLCGLLHDMGCQYL